MCLNSDHTACLTHGARERQRIFAAPRPHIDDHVSLLRLIVGKPEVCCLRNVSVRLTLPAIPVWVRVIETLAAREIVTPAPPSPQAIHVRDLKVAIHPPSHEVARDFSPERPP